MTYSTTLRVAGILGATGVALGAFGAHALEDILAERGMSNVWETAVRYHLLHAVGLICLALGLRQEPQSATHSFRWAARSWVAGIILFSGSLYGLALGGPRWLGPITPLGGAALIAGWIWLVIAVSRGRK